jgi:hypothetical protein
MYVWYMPQLYVLRDSLESLEKLSGFTMYNEPVKKQR